MVFFLFILLNATVFIRPSEWYTPVFAWPIYQCIIVVCLVLALPALLEQLSLESIRTNPITGCVLSLWLALTLSAAINPALTGGTLNFYTFGKTVVYYLLMLSVIDSMKNLNRFIFWFALVVVAAALVAVLSYHGIVDTGSTGVFSTTDYVDDTGMFTRVDRLSGPGSNYDANDFAVFLAMGIIIGAHSLLFTPRKVLRFGWLAPLGLLGYNLWLTQSRGGFLALTAAITAWSYSNWGFRKTLCFAAPLYVLVSITMMSGRMTDIELESGTGQARIQFWASALYVLKDHPIFGVGPGNSQVYMGGFVAHNAFLTMYADLGFFGGTLFMGAFATALLTLWRIRSSLARNGDIAAQRVVTMVFAATIGFAVGNLALSQGYIVSTYLVLGLAAVCCKLNHASMTKSFLKFDLFFLSRLSMASIAFVLVTHVFTRIMVRW